MLKWNLGVMGDGSMMAVIFWAMGISIFMVAGNFVRYVGSLCLRLLVSNAMVGLGTVLVMKGASRILTLICVWG